jgi:acyl-CoA synthetase (NDP forming)
VALKAASSQILHKTEVGGVKTGIQNEQALQIAFEEMYRQLFRVLPENELTFLVQQMVPQGLEVILGGRRDKEFGPIVLFGLGGILVEVLRDVSFRVAPVSEDQAMQMINETKGSILLKGYRGRPLSDIEALSSTISTFSKILIDFPEINEVEINPLFVLPKGKGCIAVDSRLSMK